MKLDLTNEDINIIGQLLEQAPYRVAAPLLAKLQKQFAEQQMAAQQAAVPAAPVADKAE